MCGIAGYVLLDSRQADAAALRRALRAMGHRGPDDEGMTLLRAGETGRDLLTDASDPGVVVPAERAGGPVPHDVAIGHRRFHLVDTSPAGHQPFWADDGSVCVAFNGEIYDYVELREELENKGRTFRTRSDTEVFVEAYREWGRDCFEHFTGFWAVALWDAARGRVLLARDRIGKAPLYVTRTDRGVFWASEIKGLFELLGTRDLAIGGDAVVDFIRRERRDVADETFYEGIRTFPRASSAWVEPDADLRPRAYWSLPAVRLSPGDIPLTEAATRLRELLADAVRLRLRADVPVGAQVSGGMDSSAILAVAATGGHRLDAYTVDYGRSGAGEEPFARKVAEHLGDAVRYHVVQPPDEDLLDNLDAFVFHMDEPFHSPNQFTNQRIWRRMRDEGLRAVLYGAGGDEVFAGYPGEYFPPWLRRLLLRGRLLRFARELSSLSEIRPGHRLRDMAFQASKIFRARPLAVPPAALDPFLAPEGAAGHAPPGEDVEERLRANMTDWRMNYWLRIDNQNSMGVPLEVRSPLLDHRVVEFAFRLPVDHLIHDGWMKWVLRRATEDILPAAVVWRRQKMGFPFPLSSWLAGARPRLLDNVRESGCPWVDVVRLEAGYDALAGRHPSYLWRLLSLGLWWRRCVRGERLA